MVLQFAKLWLINICNLIKYCLASLQVIENYLRVYLRCELWIANDSTLRTDVKSLRQYLTRTLSDLWALVHISKDSAMSPIEIVALVTLKDFMSIMQ